MKADITFTSGAAGEAHSSAQPPLQSAVRYGVMRERVAAAATRIRDERLRTMFLNCFFSSLDTAAELMDDGTTFMLTGDIPAMWLRDSAVQVMGYLPYAGEDGDVSRLIRGLLQRQFGYIVLDPYANAFNREPNNRGHKDDVTDRDSPWIWERKYEVDSLCYPLWLAQKFAEQTGDYGVYDQTFLRAFERILETFEVEQHHFEQSQYVHSRPKFPQFPTLGDGGKGNPVAYTGMTWSGYRPSDDVCTYNYLIPSNQFAVVVLTYLIGHAAQTGTTPFLSRMTALKEAIETGIQTHGIVRHPDFGTIYAYEVDGKGGVILMDDANVPSLLSLPYLGYCKQNDPVYQNTRRFILGKSNPYYFSGTAGSGVGSPHTPPRYVWHIGIIMQLLTSENREERTNLMKTLLATDAGCGVMHEAFDCDNPAQFTREWFCWANTLFAMAVQSMLDRGEL